jgi:hypothetical protein
MILAVARIRAYAALDRLWNSIMGVETTKTKAAWCLRKTMKAMAGKARVGAAGTATWIGLLQKSPAGQRDEYPLVSEARNSVSMPPMAQALDARGHPSGRFSRITRRDN